jgi:GTP-binding protein EngB required for normal cell division
MLAKRVAEGQFHIAVLGEFKRGKSTLVNALVGQAVLPSGVLPLTALGTEVSYGPPGVTIHLLDGTERDASVTSLADWVTEAANPRNERGVQRVAVRVPAPLLRPGLTLVDTPGIGSVHGHNTDAALAAAADADGAVIVLAADAPLSAGERDLLEAFRRRRARRFVVLNKVDHLDHDDVAEVVAFVRSVIDDPGTPVWPLSARAALDARTEGGPPEPGFDAFFAALSAFVGEELAAARDEVALADAQRLLQRVVDDARLAESAATLEADELDRRVAAFRAAADAQDRLFSEDQLVLAREVEELAARLGRDLAAFARAAADRRSGELEAVVASGPARQARERVRRAVERIVEDEFDGFRTRRADQADEEWLAIAAQLSGRASERISSVRQAAADIFEIDLPAVRLPPISGQRERFFYLFPTGTSLSEPLLAVGRRLVPSALLRRRALMWGRGHLRVELDKHAGRIRHDLTRRLGEARAAFESMLRDELSSARDAILCAASHGEHLRRVAADEIARHGEHDQQVQALARQIVQAASDAPSGGDAAAVTAR